MFKKILVAFDDSNESAKALDYGIHLSKENPFSTLEVLHVFYLPVMVIGEALVSAPAFVDNYQYEHAENVIAKAEQHVSAFPNATVTLKQGDPATTVVAYAEEIQSDLIIVGSRGIGGIKELLLGSVSHHIIQHSNIPVLVVK